MIFSPAKPLKIVVAAVLVLVIAALFGNYAGNGAAPIYAADPDPLCGTTINFDLTLEADLNCTGFTGTVLTVGTDGITIDGQGHKVIAPGASVMFSVGAHSDVSVLNIDLSGTVTGILLSGGSGNTFSNVDVSWAGVSPAGKGFDITSSSNNIIENSTSTNRSFAIYMVGTSPGNTFQNNNLSRTSNGIYAYHHSRLGNKILNNDLSQDTQSILFRNDSLIQISGNDYTGSANGVRLDNVDAISLAGTDLSQVTGRGLYLVNVTNSTFSGIVSNGSTGILLSGGSGNTFSNVDVSWAGVSPAGKGVYRQHIWDS